MYNKAGDGPGAEAETARRVRLLLVIAKRHTCGNPTGAWHFLTQNLTINARELGPTAFQGGIGPTSNLGGNLGYAL